MRITSGAPGARVIGIGEHRPSRVVTNDEVAGPINSSDGWIRERSGIVTRRFAAPDESVVDMATSAASKALASAGIAGDDIDLVVLATCSHPFQTPGGSSEVQDRIGATHAGAMDLNAACAGFSYALSVANDAIRAGSARHVLVVGPSDTPGIGPVVWGSDGSQSNTITQQPNYIEVQRALAAGQTTPPVALRMAGQTVFRWAVTKLAPVAQRALDAAGVTADELGAFVPHQANLRIVESLAKSQAPRERRHRPRHRNPGQHVVRIHPARLVSAPRAW
jgi:3-oxoacyl-[acyl-carrier-protein] synthase-3